MEAAGRRVCLSHYSAGGGGRRGAPGVHRLRQVVCWRPARPGANNSRLHPATGPRAPAAGLPASRPGQTRRAAAARKLAPGLTEARADEATWLTWPTPVAAGISRCDLARRRNNGAGVGSLQSRAPALEAGYDTMGPSRE